MPSLLPNPRFPPEASPFAKIAAALRPRLAVYCGIDPTFVYPVANDDYDITTLEDFFLYFQFFGIDGFGDTGGGRLNPWATRRLRVYLYTRSGVDITGEDEVALQGIDSNPPPQDASPPLGHFYAEELVIGALFNWMPLSNPALDPEPQHRLCVEPIHPASGSGPPLRKAENSEGLLRTNLDWEIKYNLYIPAEDPPLSLTPLA